METATTPTTMSVVAEPVLCLAFELSARNWKLAFSPGLGQQPRIRTVAAGDFDALRHEVAAAKRRFSLDEATRVVSCYEAGRDGFWLHRALGDLGIENHVVDSASIEVKRRRKKVKTDRLDAGRLVGMLLRFAAGETRVWSVLQVPSVEAEDRRHLHREMETVKAEHRRISNRIKALLCTHGIQLSSLEALPEKLEQMRMYNGRPLPTMFKRRLRTEWDRWVFVSKQLKELDAWRRELMQNVQDVGVQCAEKLMRLRAVGKESSWLLSMEFFSWRQFDNRRQVGALAGFTPTPYQSGDESKELGISKAGNRRVRHIMTELAWSWLRYQPQSELSQWYERRFGHGKSRLRRIGIVALARKLLIALWKYAQFDIVPAGARLKP